MYTIEEYFFSKKSWEIHFFSLKFAQFLETKTFSKCVLLAELIRTESTNILI